MKARNKLLTLTALAFFSKLALAGVTSINYADDGIAYQSITIKADKDYTHQVMEDVEYQLSSLDKLSNDSDTLFSYKGEDSSSVFSQYVIINLPDDKKSDKSFINDVIKSLNNISHIEVIYAEPVVEEPQVPVSIASEARNMNRYIYGDFVDYQYYLKPSDDHSGSYLSGDHYAVGGLDGKYAWTVAGGDGSGVNFLQKSLTSWNEDHPDLPEYYAKFKDAETGPQGSYSMGVVGARNDGRGITGFAYNATFSKAGSSVINMPDIVRLLKPGDVIHINLVTKIKEGVADCDSQGGCSVPVEYSPIWYDFIKQLTNKGVNVVEPAGDSALNLDHDDFKNKFNRKKVDSGANIVGAICASASTTAYFSNYGSRVDSSAGGCKEVSTTDNGIRYNWDYDGTGAASSVVAGAITSLSGVAIAHNVTLSPFKLRALLDSTGTEVGTEGKNVGKQPDLKPAIEKLTDSSYGVTNEACIITVDGQYKYCLKPGETTDYSLPSYIYNKKVYVNAPPGTAVVLSDTSSFSDNHYSTFIGTVVNKELKNVKVQNGSYINLSKPESMKVIESAEPLGCIITIDTDEQYCLPISKRSSYELPSFIKNRQISVSAESGTAVVLSDSNSLHYNRRATFTGDVPNNELKSVISANGNYLDLSHPKSMRVKKDK